MQRTVRAPEATQAGQRATPARRAELPARIIATLAALGLIVLISIGSRGLHGLRLGADRLRRRHRLRRRRARLPLHALDHAARRPGATSGPAGSTSSPGGTSGATPCSSRSAWWTDIFAQTFILQAQRSALVHAHVHLLGRGALAAPSPSR